MKALLVFGSCKGFLKDETHNLKNKVITLANKFTKAEKPVFIIRRNDDKKEKIQDIDSGNYVFYAKDVDAFYRSGLEKKLREIGVTELVICGLVEGPIGIFTAIAGYDRGFKVTVIKDCIYIDSSIFKKNEQKLVVDTISNMIKISKINVITFDEFMGYDFGNFNIVDKFDKVVFY